ncbi:hypothetical protein PsorP6_007026 [Peronosclerospora sorghi]|uniref:Uncharacterized protein n=1 Tax=Peronosclerospora sorghi TaxID=230839 RepID=A0ACC0WB33_9STRA|nr:hypothetical protein PsorP6_007026 [Peronosclerospora sorghi]
MNLTHHETLREPELMLPLTEPSMSLRTAQLCVRRKSSDPVSPFRLKSKYHSLHRRGCKCVPQGFRKKLLPDN